MNLKGFRVVVFACSYPAARRTALTAISNAWVTTVQDLLTRMLARFTIAFFKALLGARGMLASEVAGFNAQNALLPALLGAH